MLNLSYCKETQDSRIDQTFGFQNLQRFPCVKSIRALFLYRRFFDRLVQAFMLHTCARCDVPKPFHSMLNYVVPFSGHCRCRSLNYLEVYCLSCCLSFAFMPCCIRTCFSWVEDVLPALQLPSLHHLRGNEPVCASKD